MNYVFFLDRESGEVYSYDMDDESQVSAIKSNLNRLSQSELESFLAKNEMASQPTPEEVMQSVFHERDLLLSKAAIRIGPLQDSMDLGSGSKEDSETLIKWKEYRVAVNRVDLQDGFPTAIEWPSEPS